MSTFIYPADYKPVLGIYDTQTAIGMLKRKFEDCICPALNLKRVSAPLFVECGKGINDDLNGTERPVTFDIGETEVMATVVHSLAKWKRIALAKYEFPVGEGLYTDMNAIRRDETLDNLHSVYTDQWDWELVIAPENRCEAFLRDVVTRLVGAVCDTHDYLKTVFGSLSLTLNRDVKFITTQQLEDMYPALTPKQREDEICRKYGTVFLMQIGGKLKSGIRHDGRAPDYDDWTLNGDILFWNELLGCAFEISSMGIRVDQKTLTEQLIDSGRTDRASLYYHRLLLDGKLPQTVGGGIGQSRLSMLLLEKAHIGEVQVSVWDEKTLDEAKKHGITLL